MLAVDLEAGDLVDARFDVSFQTRRHDNIASDALCPTNGLFEMGWKKTFGAAAVEET